MTTRNARRRLIVGMSGASGAIYGIRLLERLRSSPDIEVHLVMSAAAKMNVRLETDWMLADVEALADEVHDVRDIAANISSGSYRTLGMIIAPCSIKTLSGIATSNSDNLLTRAADVVLKEGRKLVLVPRETPFSAIHLENMLRLSRSGAVILPPNPGFYHHPQNVSDLVDFVVARVLDQIAVPHALMQRWGDQAESAS